MLGIQDHAYEKLFSSFVSIAQDPPSSSATHETYIFDPSLNLYQRPRIISDLLTLSINLSRTQRTFFNNVNAKISS